MAVELAAPVVVFGWPAAEAAVKPASPNEERTKTTVTRATRPKVVRDAAIRARA